MPRVALLLAAVAALPAAALGSGCYHIRNHEQAPPVANARELAAYVVARAPASPVKVARAPRVIVSFRPGELDEYGTAEVVCTEVVPLWPYARGQWPSPEVDGVQPALQQIAFTRFEAPPGAPPDVTVELAFTPESYQRITHTVYGLSIASGVHQILGIPTAYYTVRLDADLRIHDTRGPASRPLVERHVEGVETAVSGNVLYWLVYNTFAQTNLLKGSPVLTFDDVFAEALVDLVVEIDAALAEAFPVRCAKCGVDFGEDAERCTRCGGVVARRKDAG